MADSETTPERVAQLERRVRALELALQLERRVMRVRTAYLASYVAIFQDAIRSVPVTTGDRQRDRDVLSALDRVLERLLGEWRLVADNADVDWIGMETSGRGARDLSQIYERLEAELGIARESLPAETSRRQG